MGVVTMNIQKDILILLCGLAYMFAGFGVWWLGNLLMLSVIIYYGYDMFPKIQ
jgi:hypothetical protein